MFLRGGYSSRMCRAVQLPIDAFRGLDVCFLVGESVLRSAPMSPVREVQDGFDTCRHWRDCPGGYR